MQASQPGNVGMWPSRLHLSFSGQLCPGALSSSTPARKHYLPSPGPRGRGHQSSRTRHLGPAPESRSVGKYRKAGRPRGAPLPVTRAYPPSSRGDGHDQGFHGSRRVLCLLRKCSPRPQATLSCPMASITHGTGALTGHSLSTSGGADPDPRQASALEQPGGVGLGLCHWAPTPTQRGKHTGCFPAGTPGSRPHARCISDAASSSEPSSLIPLASPPSTPRWGDTPPPSPLGPHGWSPPDRKGQQWWRQLGGRPRGTRRVQGHLTPTGCANTQDSDCRREPQSPQELLVPRPQQLPGPRPQQLPTPRPQQPPGAPRP